MGYRSDVKYVIDFTSKEAKTGFLAQVRMIGGALQAAVDETDCERHTCRIYFEADNVKWYGSFPEVQSHDDLLSMVEDMPPELCNGYYFIRMGEDYDDIGTKEGGDAPPYDAISVQRSVDFQ